MTSIWAYYPNTHLERPQGLNLKKMPQGVKRT